MKNFKIMLLFFGFLFVFFVFYNPNNKTKGESEIDLSGSIISADPSANKEKVLDGDYCNPSYWTGYTGNYWQIDLGENKTFVTDTSSFTWPGFCSEVPDLIKNEYSTNGSTWNSLITSTSPSVFSCPAAPNQCVGQRYNPVTARYLKFSVSITCDGGQFFNLAALKLFSSDVSPSPSGGTPTPTSSGTPTTSPTTTQTPTTTPTTINGTEIPYDPTKPIEIQDDAMNIELKIPNGGEKWELGKKYEIKWRWTDVMQKISTMALFLSTDNGKKYDHIIKLDLPKDKIDSTTDTGTYEWTIPDDESLITNEAKVLVAAINQENQVLINDSSDENFTIKGDRYAALGTDNYNLPLTLLAILLLLIGSSAVLWPLTLNFLLNSFMTDLLNRLPLLTAPTMGNKKSTGIVYDSQTQSAIQRAVVRIFKTENDKQLESIITNKKGEFSFLVPNGSYFLTVNSTDYDFPSKRHSVLDTESIDSRFRGNDTRDGNDNTFTPGITDGVYSNLYFGQKILIKKDEGVDQRYALNINIPLDKTSAYNIQEKALKFLRIIGNILAKIKWPSIGLGTLLAIFLCWTDFTILHLVILELYLILILYETYRLLAKTRPYGLVIDEDKTAIDLAVVRFNQDKKIQATSISGADGKFTAQVNPGDYSLLTKKIGFDEDERNISIKSARKLEGLDIKLHEY
ncbi:MAG: Uncharacterized protein CEN92_441 [Candidatus Berkelbacteria bacterium Licking1014_96]|uniref:F5/8 type C domain-containing protein n=1 Tax=Candidatus Berkelbacteria bacterium Licking1014_96 TaxID=2017149 RepID=A0A554LCK1_9BACT|nr:MAG: Uncharacterized protein CEN92_441 [Candidatus Berkelbacteria bacterium Licking1014_96]